MCGIEELTQPNYLLRGKKCTAIYFFRKLFTNDKNKKINILFLCSTCALAMQLHSLAWCNTVDSQKINSAIHIMRRYDYKKEVNILTKNKKVRVVFKDLSEVAPEYSQSNAITIKDFKTGITTVYINKSIQSCNPIGLGALLVHEAQHVASDSTEDSFSQELEAISKEMEFYLCALKENPSLAKVSDDKLLARLNSLSEGYKYIIKLYISQDSSYKKLLNINDAK